MYTRWRQSRRKEDSLYFTPLCPYQLSRGILKLALAYISRLFERSTVLEMGQ